MYALAGGSGGASYPSATLYENARYHSTTVTDITVGGNGFCAGDSATGCADAVLNDTGGATNNPNALGGGNVDCSFPRNTGPATSEPAFDPECNAVTGFDGPSGLGTPKGIGVFSSTSPKLSLTPTTVKHAVSTTFTAKATESLSAAKVNSYAFSWGDGTSTSGTAAAQKHTYAKAGNFTITLTVKDNLGQSSILKQAVRAN
jgi:PKD repeat protein